MAFYAKITVSAYSTNWSSAILVEDYTCPKQATASTPRHRQRNSTKSARIEDYERLG